ncbi:class I SAM-dependent methyltransferase [Desulfobacter postgatei]|uniref:class I SAM-dependent methyltransferase n=1 Tax=Desulfobacter postgatei TaxID=2293 RepID=UPI00259BD775|nr:class I SAM-dependent methyltransferase [uncultured Desulfobacter sp.]
MKQHDSTINCPVCGSIAVGRLHNRAWSAPDKTVYRCRQCLAAFLSPMMTRIEEEKFYAAYNDHTRKRGVTLTKDPLELHEKSIPEAVRRWKQLEKYFRQGMSVLEVGCSTGAFIEICSRTCRCACVEPDGANRQFAAQFCREQYEYIDQIPDLKQFDLICLFHVFEHIRDPADFLVKCNGLLSPGGVVIIEVPHIEDPLLSLYDLNAYKDFYFQPMHHYIYSVKALNHLFVPQGFMEKEVIYIQRYGLDNHLAWLKNEKPGGNPEFKTLFESCNGTYCKSLERAGKTDTIMYIAAKGRHPL